MEENKKTKENGKKARQKRRERQEWKRHRCGDPFCEIQMIGPRVEVARPRGHKAKELWHIPFLGKTREKGIHHRPGKTSFDHRGLRPRKKGGFPRWWRVLSSSLSCLSVGAQQESTMQWSLGKVSCVLVLIACRGFFADLPWLLVFSVFGFCCLSGAHAKRPYCPNLALQDCSTRHFKELTLLRTVLLHDPTGVHQIELLSAKGIHHTVCFFFWSRKTLL